MKKAKLEPKPRSVSDSVVQDEPRFRERSFTDVFAVFSKKVKVTTRDASTNTTPLDEAYAQPTVPPVLPPKINNYCLNKALNTVEVIYEEEEYKEVCLGRSMNVESDLTMTTPNREAMWVVGPTTEGLGPDHQQSQEEDEDYTDEDEDSEDEEDVDELPETVTTHKRNTSGLSFGSFQIGTPVELINEVLTGDEWAQFLEDNLKMRPDTFLSSQFYEEPIEFETKKEKPKDAVDVSDIDEIMKTLKIIEKKAETPKVLDEEPELPHLLPPKLTPSSGAGIGIDKRFRSSIFYSCTLPPPGRKTTETAKSGTLNKIKAKLRKSSVEETEK